MKEVDLIYIKLDSIVTDAYRNNHKYIYEILENIRVNEELTAYQALLLSKFISHQVPKTFELK